MMNTRVFLYVFWLPIAMLISPEDLETKNSSHFIIFQSMKSWLRSAKMVLALCLLYNYSCQWLDWRQLKFTHMHTWCLDWEDSHSWSSYESLLITVGISLCLSLSLLFFNMIVKGSKICCFGMRIILSWMWLMKSRYKESSLPSSYLPENRI